MNLKKGYEDYEPNYRDQKREMDMHINLLDCENCESTKEGDEDASLFRYQIYTIFDRILLYQTATIIKSLT